MTKYFINLYDQLIVAREMSIDTTLGRAYVQVLYSDMPRFPTNTQQGLILIHWRKDFIQADSRAKKIKIIRRKFE